jgi:hypothetical protein
MLGTNLKLFCLGSDLKEFLEAEVELSKESKRDVDKLVVKEYC